MICASILETSLECNVRLYLFVLLLGRLKFGGAKTKRNRGIGTSIRGILKEHRKIQL